jgi:hypothetical protein
MKCLLCDQEAETLEHLVACSFSRIFWYQLLRKFGLHSLAPQPAVTSFFQKRRGAALFYIYLRRKERCKKTWVPR